jgi:apolipoprotein N-acyltransferase
VVPARPRWPTRSSTAHVLAAAAAGIGTWTSFPPLSWWWAAPLSVAVLVVALRRLALPAAAAAGLAYGLATFVPLLAFLRGLGVDAWLVVAALESLWFVVFALAAAVVVRRPWWPLAVPTVWLAVEWLRDRWPWHGFPWGRIAFGQADGPLLPWAAVGGAPAVTLVVLAVAVALAWTAGNVSRGRRQALVGVGATLAVGVVAVSVAAAVSVPVKGTGRGGAPSHAVVAAVQGDVPRLGLAAFAQRRAVTVNHRNETVQLARAVAAGTLPAPRLVIWPENATDVDPFSDALARGMIEQAVSAVRVPILVGAVVDTPDHRHVQNTAIVWGLDGPGQRYVKRHLVPFGEYLPLRGLLTRIVGRFDLIARDFVPGHRRGVLDAAGIRVADVICFEVADDGIVRDAVTGGGRLLVVQTNNATYEHPGDDGHGGETAQQLDMSRLRAVEHGRAVVVAATSGVSALIMPNGEVHARSRVFVPASLVADLPLRDPLTLADRLGAWPERVLAALGLLSVVAAAVPRRSPVAATAADPDPELVAP